MTLLTLLMVGNQVAPELVLYLDCTMWEVPLFISHTAVSFVPSDDDAT